MEHLDVRALGGQPVGDLAGAVRRVVVDHEDAMLGGSAGQLGQRRVTELPGIGKTLAEKLDVLLETGSIPSAEKLKAKFPPGLIEITWLPGLGPKKARRLFDELGIDSLDKLKEAAEKERIRKLRGF